jgi:hypothetical protein
MAHVGREPTLGAVGDLGHFLGLSKLSFHFLSHSNLRDQFLVLVFYFFSASERVFSKKKAKRNTTKKEATSRIWKGRE